MNLISNKLKKYYYNHVMDYPLHANEKYQPFFIIGSGRSGNTLLRRILNLHRELYIPPETYVMGEVINLYKNHQRIGWINLVKLIYASYEFHPEFDTFGIDNLLPLYKEVSTNNKEERSLANIFHAFYTYYKNVHELTGIRWGDKTPLNTLYMNEILEVFPKAQFIHIIRNPYDAIYSYVKTGIYKDYRSAAERWRTSVEIACRFGLENPKNYFEIEYECLVERPVVNIKNICIFLGIKFEESMLEMNETSESLGDVKKYQHHANVLKPISNENVGKGSKSMSKGDIIMINSVLNQSNNNKIINYLI